MRASHGRLLRRPYFLRNATEAFVLILTVLTVITFLVALFASDALAGPAQRVGETVPEPALASGQAPVEADQD